MNLPKYTNEVKDGYYTQWVHMGEHPWNIRYAFISGIDEVGRGSLAGPLMAVATLFDCQREPDSRIMPIPGIRDSKKYGSVGQREEVYHRILRYPHLVDFGIGEVSVEEINHYGIGWANDTAFSRALLQLKALPYFTIVDGVNGTGDYWKGCKGRELVVPKADQLYWQVGAASVLAKVIRDRYMRELHEKWPMYDWFSNAGYNSPKHTEGLRQYGPSPHHRTQFVKGILSR